MINLGFRHSRARFRALAILPPSCTSQHGISGHIIGDVAQSDLGSDTDYTNSTHYRAAGTHGHDAKDVFNSAPYPCPASISLLLSSGEFLVPAAFSLNMFAKSLFLQLNQRVLGTICRICPDISAGIAWIKQFGKDLAVMDTCISHFVAANKLVPDINADMVLIAKERFTILLRPAGIGVFLSPLCRVPR